MSILGHASPGEVPLDTQPGADPPPPPPPPVFYGAFRSFVRNFGMPLAVLLPGADLHRGDALSSGPVIATGRRSFVRNDGAPPSFFDGRVSRRGGVPTNVERIENIRRYISRTVRSPEPDPNSLLGKVTRRGGHFSPGWTTFHQTYEQAYRVANTALAKYELYVGVDGPPDFSAPPTATSPTLPFTWTPTPPGAGSIELHMVVRQRNKYDLQSFNVFETVRTIHSTGTIDAAPVSPPIDVRIYDGDEGYAIVVAKYMSIDDPLPANTWDLYVKIGSTPVPGVDVATYTGPITFMGVEGALSRIVGPYTPGTLLHVVLAARRSSDGVRGVAAEVLFTLATSLALPDVGLFGGEHFEQR